MTAAGVADGLAAATAHSAGRVPWPTRIAYALPALAMAVVGIPFFVYVPKFYTDVVGVDIAVLGAILLVMRLFDGVIDPFIGGASDRIRSPFGRRRSFMLIGLLPFVAGLFATFVPPEGMSPVAAAAWFASCMIAVSLFWSVVQVPYESLGTELSFDYEERTSLLGLRDGMLLFGTVLAAASPAIAAALLGHDDASRATGAAQRESFQWLALVYAPLVLLACLYCIARVRERTDVQAQAPTSSPWRAARELAGNRPFVMLLASYTVTAIGSNLPATLIPFYVQYVLGDPNAEAYLLLYFVTGVLFLPLWVAAARRIGKRNAWLVSGTINAASFAGVFLLGVGDTTAYAVLVMLSGIGFGAATALPSSMQADVIDYEEFRSGARREGEIIGIWSVARKWAAALGVGLALPLLGWVGYEANAAQSEAVVFTLKALYALVPALLTLAGLVIAWNYPIDKARHQAILAAIAARQRGETPADPLAGALAR